MEILDCTFRDGGYYTNWDFGQATSKAYISSMSRLPVDWVEIGYRGQLTDEYRGEYYFLPIDTIKRLSSQLSGKKLAAMINAKEWDSRPSDLELNLAKTVDYLDMVRIAADSTKIESARQLVDVCHSLGFTVAVNLMYGHRFIGKEAELKAIQDVFKDTRYLYLVDSYGHLRPSQVQSMVSALCDNSSEQRIGFHAHDNLTLALGNSIAAISGGAQIIDSTVLGIGRGAGNLRTELLLTYLFQSGEIELDLKDLTPAVDAFEQIRDKDAWGASLPYIISGAFALPQKEVMDLVQSKRHSLETIVSRTFSSPTKVTYSLPAPDSFGPETPVLLVGGGHSVESLLAPTLTWLAQDESLVIVHSSKRHLSKFASLRHRQIVFLSGNEYKKVLADLEEGVPMPRNLTTILDQSNMPLEHESRQLPSPKLFEMKEEGLNKSGFAMALAFLEEMRITKAHLIGFDGYVGTTEDSKFLHLETQMEIDSYLGKISLVSLAPSSYRGLSFCPIFGLIE